MWVRYDPGVKKYLYSLDNGQNWNLLEFDASVITQGTLGINRIPAIPYSKLSLADGDIPAAKVSGVSLSGHTHVWGDVSKVGSSLSDLATRAVANLSDGANVAMINAANVFSLDQSITKVSPALILNPTGFKQGRIASHGGLFLDHNCAYDSVGGVWNLADTSAAGGFVQLGGGTLIVNYLTAGANPRSPTATFSLDTAGVLTLAGGLKERNRSTALGEWINPGYSASNYATSNAAVWTITNFYSYSYTLIGKTMLFKFSSDGSIDINCTLQLKLPGGYAAASSGFHQEVIVVNPGGTFKIGAYVYINNGSPYLQIVGPSGGVFTAGTIGVHGVVILEVNA